jgi:MFS family permease
MTYHLNPSNNPDGRPFLDESVSQQLASFIRTFTMVVYSVMGMAVLGLLLKVLAVTGGSFVFVFSMAMLLLLFLVQVGLSFFYVIANVRLALLGAFCSLALVSGFLALIFRYQDWFGWQMLFLAALPLYLLAAVFMVLYFRRYRRLHEPLRHFLYRNLLLPLAFLLVLAIVSLLVDADVFNRGDEGWLEESPLQTETGADTGAR